MKRFPSILPYLAALLLVTGAATAATDDLQVRVTAASPHGPVHVVDNDGIADDGTATKGAVFVDFTVPGTAFVAGQAVGSVSFALEALDGGAGSAIYPVGISIDTSGDPAIEADGAVNAMTVQLPGSEPRSLPEAMTIPVALTADEARVGALAACEDGVPPPALVHSLSFSNPTVGRNKLGNGPNVKLRVTLSCVDAELVFCTAGQGCFGQPGGDAGGEIAMCNDPLAGWLTVHADQVLPLTVGGSHEMNGPLTEAGACAAGYPTPGADGQGTGYEFQTICDSSGAIAYLPAGTKPGVFRPDLGSNRELGGAGDMLGSDRQGSGSRGSGAGVLAGQALALKLSLALGATGHGPYVPAGPGSCVAELDGFVCGETTANAGASCDRAGSPEDGLCFDRVAFVPAALGDFELPHELCTQLSGADRRLNEAGCGTDSDDLCQSFVVPDCAAGLTVNELLAAGEQVLSGGASGVCGDDPSALNQALDLVNRAFDGCGKVVECPTTWSFTPQAPGGDRFQRPRPLRPRLELVGSEFEKR